MVLFKEIAESLGISEYAPTAYCFTIVANRGGYFQNVKKISDIKRNVLVLKSTSAEIIVHGEDLFVASFSGGDLSLRGKITCVEVK